MATTTDKKFITKNGLQAQNIAFVDSVSNESHRMNTEMLSSDTLSFSAESGQLFSITDSLTGTIFSVNDISGIPAIEVDDDATIRFAEFDGNVLVGTSTDNDTDKLQINGSTLIGANELRIADEGIDSKIETASGVDLLINPTGGNVGIGTTSANDTLDVNGGLTAVSITETSSIALKTNIEPIQNALDAVIALAGVSYTRISTGKRESGLIAEDVEQIAPELVSSNGEHKSISYSRLTAYLIEAVKDLQREISELKNG